MLCDSLHSRPSSFLSLLPPPFPPPLPPSLPPSLPSSLCPSLIVQLTLPMDSQSDGSELTKEPFRWDQRLFTVLLRLPGMGGVNTSSNGVEMSLSTMSETTGGMCSSSLLFSPSLPLPPSLSLPPSLLLTSAPGLCVMHVYIAVCYFNTLSSPHPSNCDSLN